MRRKTYRQMKKLGWDRFVTSMIGKGLKPKDLLKTEKVVEMQTYLATNKLIEDIEKDLYALEKK